MYIKSIHIQNYRNFNNFKMEFQKGLNVITGANNSGKTGLLYAIKLLDTPSDISVDDFNKNNLLNYSTLYIEDAPRVTIAYKINHTISEDNTDDESIIRLLPFIGMKELAEKRKDGGDIAEYDINAQIKAVYSLDPKHQEEYKKAVADIKDFDEYMQVLKRFVMKYYSWRFTNGISETKAEQKEATEIFDIRLIEAERTSEEVRKETRREINAFTKDPENEAKFDDFKLEVSEGLKDLIDPTITKLSDLFENEKNEIGLEKGNVSIASSVRADFSLSDTYITEVMDTKAGYVVPLQHNGLGYNNLINIYMLIKLTEIRKGKDFRILCLEEPEAHLHPAMQYKLFKYLRELDKNDDLNQQIFVTTHSSNISAVAGIENMYMLAYCREGEDHDCCQQSLKEQFTYIAENEDEEDTVTTAKTEEKVTAKAHLAKFLDVTRSDMLFADKVILVEGIAEKLLMPVFMSKCGCSYEDEHIAILEIGGKHFGHFVELFNKNNVEKKVLCITDKDFKWIDDDEHAWVMRSIKEYEEETPQHIETLLERFPINNFAIRTQTLGGKTFEDEFFLTNMGDIGIAKEIFKTAIPEKLGEFLDKHGFSISEWDKHKGEMDGRTLKCIGKFLNAFNARRDKTEESKSKYESLLFAEVFLHYAKSKKGDVALELITNDKFNDNSGASKLIVPQYIQEGLEWLLM